MSSATVAQQLARLAQLRPGETPIVSCYLKLEPRDRARGKYLIKLKNRVREVVETLPRLGFPASGQAAVARDLDRIQQALRAPGSLPSTQGVALFASEGLRLFEAIALPWVYRSRLAVDRTALVRELLAAEDEVGRLLTVVLDRQGARLFEVTAFGATEAVDLRADGSPGGRFHSDRHGAPGVGEHAYHNRIRRERQRHLGAVAEAVFQLDRRRPVHGLILAGVGTDTAALQPFLHPYLRDRVMGTAKLNLQRSSPAEVLAATLAARAAFESRAEARAVRDLREGLGTGWAVNGLRKTLAALGAGQARSLLVASDLAVPGFRCAASGRLVLGERECRTEGGAVPVIDVMDDALEEALRQRVEVEVIHSPEARQAVDGLAALLRFR